MSIGSLRKSGFIILDLRLGRAARDVRHALEQGSAAADAVG